MYIDHIKSDINEKKYVENMQICEISLYIDISINRLFTENLPLSHKTPTPYKIKVN